MGDQQQFRQQQVDRDLRIHSTARRIDKTQLIHLIARLSQEAHNRKPVIGRERRAVARRRARRQRPPRTRRRLDVEIPRLAAILALAQLRADPVLARGKREAGRRAPRAAVPERRPARERHRDGVEAAAAAERQHGGDGRGRQAGQVVEPAAVRAAPEAALAEGRRQRPGEGDELGVVVREYLAEVGGVGVEEVAADVGEALGLQGEAPGWPVEDLVHGLAGLARRGVLAHHGIGAGSGVDAVLLELDPGVGEAALGMQDADPRVCAAGVAAVGVADDEDGVSSGPRVDVICDLLEVGSSRGQISRFRAKGRSVKNPGNARRKRLSTQHRRAHCKRRYTPLRQVSSA